MNTVPNASVNPPPGAAADANADTRRRPATGTPPALPTTIPGYLDQLRLALAGADPALVQDALYDAEEYLRSELAEQPGVPEADVIASVAGSYGAPDEVADIYRDTEVRVTRALRPPPVKVHRSALGRFFGVVADPRAYTALLFMLLSLVTGTFYFTWLVTGFSTSIGMLVLIIGLPLLVVFLGSVRLLSLAEGRLVEALLGTRMPRRPLYTQRDKPWLTRMGEMFTDARTWTSSLYLLLMLPLGIAYFTVAITLVATSLSLIAVPFLALFGAMGDGLGDGFGDTTGIFFGSTNLMAANLFVVGPLCLVSGLLIGVCTLHLAKGVGYVHGALAKALLVRDPVV